MFKNIIIIILVFLLCSLMFQNKENIKLIAKDLADTKDLVVGGGLQSPEGTYHFMSKVHRLIELQEQLYFQREL